MARTPADSDPRSAVSRRTFIRRAVLHANLQPGAAGVLVRVTGENTADLALMGAGLAEFGPEISPEAVTHVVTARQPEPG